MLNGLNHITLAVSDLAVSFDFYVGVLDPDGHKLEVHAGSLDTRLKALTSKPYKGLTWY